MDDLLSGHIITVATLILGFAMACFRNPTMRLCGFWFVAEVVCSLVTVGVGEYANAQQMLTYRYLYAITSIIFCIHVSKTGSKYSDKIGYIFKAIAIFSVTNGEYHWFMQSQWVQWGEAFALEYGSLVNNGYFFIIAGLDALLVILGVSSALAAHFINRSNERLR